MKFPADYSPVVYLSSEFAIDSDLPTYAGGLGVLAGDLLKEAGDENYPMIGIGILYKGKTFLQHITGEGKEEKRDSQFDHDTSFLRPLYKDDTPLEILLSFFGQEIKIRSYYTQLADNTLLFFLSTDVDGNPPEWIQDMDAVYRGDTEGQIRQQLLLGLGGYRLMKTLGITPRLYHINEGRPEFVAWELFSSYYKEQDSIPDAFKKTKKHIVYTNHTLVAAGNLTYPTATLKRWAEEYVKNEGLEIDPWELVRHGDTGDTFSITKYALEVSKTHSAVSQVHCGYARKEWPDYDWVSITNGVHMNTWQDSDFRRDEFTDHELWNLHVSKKHELARSVLERTGYGFDPNRLVISWARRLAEYKQPLAIFENIERLVSLVKNTDRPVQLLFAGNSHSSDPRSKEIIEKIISIASSDLSGHLIFIPNYNTSLANHLVSGSDVWLNTPKGNLEASGTSGMKAAANGVLNCTVKDGWTYEVDWEGKGWTLDPKEVSRSFYSTLENSIIPEYYDCKKDGLPYCWVKMMRASITMAKEYSTTRMLAEYKEKLYI